MAGRGIPTTALIAAAAGSAFIYLGIKGISLASGLRSILGGKVPAELAGGPLGNVVGLWAPITATDRAVAGAMTGASAGASGVAAAAVRYQGSGSKYKWAGASPTNGWDCSGFVNYVVSHDAGKPIPGYKGGAFTGKSHGPTTHVWAVWTGASTIRRADVAAGDLLIWPAFHMGIAVSNTQMINCPGPNGTPAPILSNIDGGGTGVLVCRRLKG
jgi:hypothetical protein